MSKATDAEIEQRVSEIVKLLIKGSSRASILQYCAENFGIATRQADEYISRAHDILIEEAEKSRSAAFGKAVARHEYILRRAMEGEDFQLADRQQDRLNSLFGNYAPSKQVNVNSDASTLDELNAEIRKLEERARALADLPGAAAVRESEGGETSAGDSGEGEGTLGS